MAYIELLSVKRKYFHTNQLIFVTVKCDVLFEERNGFLNIITSKSYISVLFCWYIWMAS
jgi:hypothetical protein